MKKTILAVFITATLIACKDKKSSTAPAVSDTQQAATATGNDEALTAWLKGKMLSAENTALDYHQFKLNTDGTCEDKGGAKANWTIEGGKLNIGGMLKIGIEKKDDQTIILHRSLSDETYQIMAIP